MVYVWEHPYTLIVSAFSWSIFVNHTGCLKGIVNGEHGAHEKAIFIFFSTFQDFEERKAKLKLSILYSLFRNPRRG